MVTAERNVATATWAKDAFEDAQMAAYDSSPDEEEIRSKSLFLPLLIVATSHPSCYGCVQDQ